MGKSSKFKLRISYNSPVILTFCIFCTLILLFDKVFFAKLNIVQSVFTVVGSDKVGIIAKVTAYLAEHSINIIDISQTILSGNFVMMMMVNLDSSDITIDQLRTEMTNRGNDMEVDINIMSERVFSAMHRV